MTVVCMIMGTLCFVHGVVALAQGERSDSAMIVFALAVVLFGLK